MKLGNVLETDREGLLEYESDEIAAVDKDLRIAVWLTPTSDTVFVTVRDENDLERIDVIVKCAVSKVVLRYPIVCEGDGRVDSSDREALPNHTVAVTIADSPLTLLLLVRVIDPECVAVIVAEAVAVQTECVRDFVAVSKLLVAVLVVDCKLVPEHAEGEARGESELEAVNLPPVSEGVGE